MFEVAVNIEVQGVGLSGTIFCPSPFKDVKAPWQQLRKYLSITFDSAFS
jgi:hypothetical protein